MVAATMNVVADDMQTLVIPGTAEEAPQETLAALTLFLGPYREQALISA
jgi:hypothetical protein